MKVKLLPAEACLALSPEELACTSPPYYRPQSAAGRGAGVVQDHERLFASRSRGVALATRASREGFLKLGDNA